MQTAEESMRPKDRRATPRPQLAPEQRWLVGLFFAVVVGQCLLIATAVFAVNAARAYVTGESLWSKAQKNATRHLLRHAATGDPAEYDAYRAEIAVPLADRRAREAMFADPPEPEAARQALIDGRNHPDDAGAMVVFMRLFRGVPDVAAALEIWGRADDAVAELDALATALHLAMQRDPADAAEIRALTQRIEGVDARLDSLEEDFSYAIGAATRRVQSVLVPGASAAAALLLILGAVLTARLIEHARRFENQLRKLVENASDLFTLLDPQGRYLFASPNIETQLGWTPEDLAGRSALDLVHPDDRARVIERIAMVIAHPDQPQKVEFRFENKHGGYRIYESVGTALVEGGETELVVVSRDVTETRALEQDLLRAQKMESIGRLAGGIAHDFNNVLTALIGHAEEARSDPDDPVRVKGELDEIVLGAERAARLTQQLLAFARRQVIAPRVIDLGALLIGLREMLRRLLGEGISLAIRVDPALGSVRADPGQIEQVVVNLVLNARDAMPEGGRVSIEAANLRVEPGSEWVQLSVADTGCGIDADTASHLFEPFFTTKPNGLGTGLGLATCYGIVQQAGGEIRVASEPGRGTRFDVLLPRVEAAAVEPAPAPIGEARGGHETVLVVEDESMVRRVTVRNLEAKGYRVLAATDGVEALDLLETQGDAIALVVSDVVMPRLGGPALAERIALRWPRVRVLLVSGYANDATLPSGAAAAFLHKPFSRDELARAVRAAIDA